MGSEGGSCLFMNVSGVVIVFTPSGMNGGLSLS